MEYSLFVEARFCLAVLERILRVVRHRGFELCFLKMVRNNSNVNNINIYLILRSDRSLDLLYTQLEKLIDVMFIKVD